MRCSNLGKPAVDPSLFPLDPDVTFLGTQTVCISQTGNFGGAPSGSHKVTTSSWTEAMSHVGTGKRVLLRGDSEDRLGVEHPGFPGEAPLGGLFGPPDQLLGPGAAHQGLDAFEAQRRPLH